MGTINSCSFCLLSDVACSRTLLIRASGDKCMTESFLTLSIRSVALKGDRSSEAFCCEEDASSSLVNDWEPALFEPNDALSEGSLVSLYLCSGEATTLLILIGMFCSDPPPWFELPISTRVWDKFKLGTTGLWNSWSVRYDDILSIQFLFL